MIQPVDSLLLGICGNKCIELFCGEAEDVFHGMEKIAGVGDRIAHRFFFPRGFKVVVQLFGVFVKCLVCKVPAHSFVPVGEVLICVADPECGFPC